MSINFPKKVPHLSNKNFLTYGICLLLFALIIATIILGSVPPVDRDALTHHLFVPKLWLQHGGIYEIPEVPFSYYPMNLDLLYTIALYFGNDIVPKYIHSCFALLTALLLYRYLAKRLGTNYGLLGALFFLSIPIIVKLSITVYVDLGLVFFTTAALLLLIQWAESEFRLQFLLLAGICCGLAAGTKYNGLVTFIVLTLLVPIIYQRRAPKHRKSNTRAMLWGVTFAIVAMTSLSPWLIRNYIWTGNPIYPLHNSLFQKLNNSDINRQTVSPVNSTGILQQGTQPGNNAFIARKILYNEPWWQALFLPIRFFFEGRDDDPKFFDGKLTPFLLLLPTLALLLKPPDAQRRCEQKILLFFSLLYFFFTFFQEALRIRYVVAIVPPLTILSIYGLHGIVTDLSMRIKSPTLKQTAFILIGTFIPALMLWYNFQYISSQFTLVQPLPYLRGKISKGDYITKFRSEYPTIQFANSILPPDTKVLCIFLGNRGYYMNFRPVFDQPYSSGLLSNFLVQKRQDKNILKEMRQKNITHILLHENLSTSWFRQLSSEDQSSLSPLFENASKPLFRQEGYIFFRIINSKEKV